MLGKQLIDLLPCVRNIYDSSMLFHEVYDRILLRARCFAAGFGLNEKHFSVTDQNAVGYSGEAW